MGNVEGKSEMDEDQEGAGDTREPEVVVLNRPASLQSSPVINIAQDTNHVSSKQIAPQENLSTSPQKTIIISRMVNGSASTTPPPLAKSRFRLTISRQGPGRPTFQPNSSEDCAGHPSETPELTMTPIIVETNQQIQTVPKVAPTDTVALSETDNGESQKPKEVNLFQWLFKPEKKVQLEERATVAEGALDQEVEIAANQNRTLQRVPETCNLREESPEPAASGQRADPPETTEDLLNGPDTDLNPVMSFFKTLVNKPPKSEEELKSEEKEKKENGGLRKSSSKKEKGRSLEQLASELELAGHKKSDSPKSSTLGRLFRSKSKKDEESSRAKISATADEGKSAKEATRPRLFWRKSVKGDPPLGTSQENVAVEQPAVSVSVNTEKSAPESVVAQDLQQVDTVVLPIDAGNPMKATPSRPPPFWRKSFKADPPPSPKTQENVAVEQPAVSVSVNTEKSAPDSVAPQDTIVVPIDTENIIKETPSWPVPFWKKSFKADSIPPSPKKQENVSVEQSAASAPVNTEESAPGPTVVQNLQQADTIVVPIDTENHIKGTPSWPVPFWKKVSVEQSPVSAPVNSEESAPQPTVVQNLQQADTIVVPIDTENHIKGTPSWPVPFWKKSIRVDPAPPPPKIQEDVAVEQPAMSVSVNSENSAPESVAAQDLPQANNIVVPIDTENPIKETPSRPVPFWKKSFRVDPPPPHKNQENVAVEQPAVSVSANIQNSAPELVAAQDLQQADAIVVPTETENTIKEAPSRPAPFWRKSFRADLPPPPPPPKNEENEQPGTGQLTNAASTETTPQSSKHESGAKAGTSAEKGSPEGKKSEEGKNTKPKLMMFFKQLSVMSDPDIAASDEANGKGSDSPSLDITDGVEVAKSGKTVVTAVVEPPPPPPLLKAKENHKDKKGSSEKLNKQESRENPEIGASLQVQTPELAPDAADSSRESQLKRTEKRQSLGSFFKAIGPKRLCDAEVQTDPVSILPAEKSK